MLRLVQLVDVQFMLGTVIATICTFIFLLLDETGLFITGIFVFMTIYSDKPGNHNFDLLKKLVLPDGSVIRAQLPGRPTRDSLFVDPARDGTRFVFLTLVSVFLLKPCSLKIKLKTVDSFH